MKFWSRLWASVFLSFVLFSPAFSANLEIYGFRIQDARVENQGKVYPLHVYDRTTKKEYFIEIAFTSDHWVGSGVYETSLRSFSDYTRFEPVRDSRVSAEEERRILIALENTLNEIREKDGLNVKTPERPKATEEKTKPGLDLSPGRKVTDKYGIEWPARPSPEMSGTHRSRSYEFSIKSQAAFAERMNSLGWSAREHHLQQQALRNALQQKRDQVLEHLESQFRSEESYNARVKAELLLQLYNYNLRRSQSASAAETTKPFPTDKRVTREIHLTEMGINSLVEKAHKLHAAGQWEELAEILSLLTNPWSGITGDERIATLVDDEGVMKGPAIKPNSIPVKQAAPETALALRQALNAIQGQVQANPYYLQLPKSRKIISSGLVAGRLAVHGAPDSPSLKLSQSVAAFLTGVGPVTRLSFVKDSYGAIRAEFNAESSIPQALSGPEGASLLAKATYAAMMDDMSAWLPEVLESHPELLIKKNTGTFVKSREASFQLISGVVEEPAQFMQMAQQVYSSPLIQPQWQNPNSPLVQQAQSVLFNFQQNPATSSHAAVAQTSAMEHFAQADAALAIGNTADAAFWQEAGLAAADVGLGFIPVVGWAKDIYEAATGKALLTSKSLSDEERFFAVIGVFSVGYGSKFKLGAQVLNRFGDLGALPLGVIKKIGLKASDEVGALVDFTKRTFGNEVGALGKVKLLINKTSEAGIQLSKKSLEDITKIRDNLKAGKFLPENYITKEQAQALGWVSKKGNLNEVALGKMIGGDIYKNRNGILPPNKKYFQADIGYENGFRGTERAIISDDGKLYLTTEHYKNFVEVE